MFAYTMKLNQNVTFSIIKVNNNELLFIFFIY